MDCRHAAQNACGHVARVTGIRRVQKQMEQVSWESISSRDFRRGMRAGSSLVVVLTVVVEEWGFCSQLSSEEPSSSWDEAAAADAAADAADGTFSAGGAMAAKRGSQ